MELFSEWIHSRFNEARKSSRKPSVAKTDIDQWLRSVELLAKDIEEFKKQRKIAAEKLAKIVKKKKEEKIKKQQEPIKIGQDDKVKKEEDKVEKQPKVKKEEEKVENQPKVKKEEENDKVVSKEIEKKPVVAKKPKRKQRNKNKLFKKS